MLCVRESNPDVTIYMLFENAYKPIAKGSKTTYADWCKANGFEWAQFPDVPRYWLEAERSEKEKDHKDHNSN